MRNFYKTALLLWIFLGISLIFYLDRTGRSLTLNIHDLTNVPHMDQSKFSLVSQSPIITRKEVLIRNPYPEDSSCKNLTISLFEDNSFEPVSLISYPGSGNTWFRHLIELASGVFTGSIYGDISLYSKGFKGEMDHFQQGSTIAQKMHLHYSAKLNISKAILLIRDPYKAIVSFTQYLQSGHIGRGSIHTFRRKEWPKYVLGEVYKWIGVSKSWIEAPITLHVIYYEVLMKKTLREMEIVCSFLDVPCPNLGSRCFTNHSEGEFHRTKIPVIEPIFPEWVKIKVNSGIDYLDKLLQDHGHESLPKSLYDYYKKRSTSQLTTTKIHENRACLELHGKCS